MFFFLSVYREYYMNIHYCILGYIYTGVYDAIRLLF